MRTPASTTTATACGRRFSSPRWNRPPSSKTTCAKIIEIGKEQIPAGLKLRTGIEDAIRWFDEKPEFDYLFDKIMKKYKSDNFTDVKVNFPIMVAGLLLGNGDFSKSICDAVNFGEDTDCTGATVGSILGIMNPDGIPKSGSPRSAATWS